MPINILMPALSPTMEKGNLAKWHVKEGDKVTSGDVIAEIETDKATMEVEAVDEGTVAKIVVAEGAQDVPVNDVIAVLAGEGEDAKAAASAEAKAPSGSAKASAPPSPQARAAEGGSEAGSGAAGCSRRHSGRIDARGNPRGAGGKGQRAAHLRLAARPPPGAREQARAVGACGLRPARPHRQARHRGGAEERGRQGAPAAPAAAPPAARRAAARPCRTSRSASSTRRAATSSSPHEFDAEDHRPPAGRGEDHDPAFLSHHGLPHRQAAGAPRRDQRRGADEEDREGRGAGLQALGQRHGHQGAGAWR